MTRIASYASNNLLLSYLSETNRRLQDEQVQLTTNKRSQTYSGISAESQRLVTAENAYDSLDQFIKNNDTAAMRLDISTTALESIRATIRDFEEELQRYQASAVKDRNAADHLQSSAFRGMLGIASYLNTEADGRFVFAGGRTDTTPVDVPFTTLAQFQAVYDGATITYPTTRDAHLEDFSIAADGNDRTNWLTFERDNLATPPKSRITAATAQFANVAVGTKITITGTASNNGTYTVSAVGGGGTQIDIATEMLTDELTAAINVNYPNPDSPTQTLTLSASADFNRAGDTITYAGGALAAIPVGSAFTVAGSASNNGTYTVVSNTGGVITVKAKKLTNEGTAATPYFNFTSAAGDITFTNNASPTKDTITTVAGSFSTLRAGMRVLLTGGAGTNGDNDTYTVDSVSSNGKTITIREDLPAATATDANAITFLTQTVPGTVAADSYYNGDKLTLSHRPSTTREIDWDLNAASAVFEKAFRAMGLIAQGAYRGEGGLDQNGTRISQALYLVRSSLYVTAQGTPPFGTELAGSLEATEEDLGFKQVLLKETSAFHTTYRSYLENSMAKIENVDRNEVITHILDDTRVLEASYQSLSRIRQLSLVDYLR